MTIDNGDAAERNGERTLVARELEGTDALVGTGAGEIFLDIPASSPRYIRVVEGGVVQEGDVRSKSPRELASTSLQKWRVRDIGPETVVGVDLDTGEETEWERSKLEQFLANGAYSTWLTGFERVSVTQTGDWEEFEESGREPSVTVVVYGNDGRKFTQTYRFAKPGDDRRPELDRDDRRAADFDEELRGRFERAVELALRNEGFSV